MFEIGGTPVPVGFGYRPPVAETTRALEEFLEAYEVPFEFLLAGDTLSSDQPITVLEDRIMRVPFWFYLMLC